MKIILYSLLLIFSVSGTAQTKISLDELNSLMGEWTGTLTYMDYSSNEPFSMPANVTVNPGKKDNQVLLFYEYPNEPQANSKGKVTISKEGLAINGDPLISRENLENGDTQFTTESSGKDNNEKALIRNIYVIGEKRFVIRKEVKFDSSDEWLQRNEFKFERD
jgi:hypothetical protein